MNNKNEILIQKRSENKDLYPSLLDLSAAEHVKSGETYEEAAKRGLKEEIGLNADRLTYVGKVLFRQEWETEFNAIYFTETNKKINEMKVDKEEVEEVKFIPLEKVKEMIDKNKELFVPKINIVMDKFLKVYKNE